MLNFMSRLNLMSLFNFMRLLCFGLNRLCFWFVLNFGNHFMLNWLCMLYRFMLYCFMLDSFMLNWFMLDSFMLNWFMLNRFVLNGFMLYFFLNFMLRFMLHFGLYFMFCWFLFNFSFCFRILLFLSFFGCLFLFGISFWLHDSLRPLLEWFRDVSNCSPVFSMFLLLSPHFDEKSSGKNFLIIAGSDEVDGIDFALEYDFEGSRIVLFNFDEIELRKCFLDIFLNSLEIAFDEIEWDMFYLIVQTFDLFD